MTGLIGIGVGPGDVELLTVKAVKAIQNADIIMCPASKETRPSIALSVVSSIIDKSKNQEIIKNQKERAMGPLMGIVMKELRGKASGEIINKLLLKNIKKKLERN